MLCVFLSFFFSVRIKSPDKQFHESFKIDGLQFMGAKIC